MLEHNDHLNHTNNNNNTDHMNPINNPLDKDAKKQTAGMSSNPIDLEALPLLEEKRRPSTSDRINHLLKDLHALLHHIDRLPCDRAQHYRAILVTKLSPLIDSLVASPPASARSSPRPTNRRPQSICPLNDIVAGVSILPPRQCFDLASLERWTPPRRRRAFSAAIKTTQTLDLSAVVEPYVGEEWRKKRLRPTEPDLNDRLRALIMRGRLLDTGLFRQQ